MRQSNLFSKIAISAFAGLMFTATAANATIWDIVQVRGGSGGFGASGFHDARGQVDAGTDLGTINNGFGAIFGSFNDLSGEFNVNLSVVGSGVVGSGNFTLNNSTGVGSSIVNPLIFTGSTDQFGTLAAPATLELGFVGAGSIKLGDSSPLSSTTIGFRAGFICCGNNGNDPNSFLEETGISGIGAILTLWGANGFGIDSGVLSYNNSPTLGMDLRLGLSISDNQNIPQVPLPAALPLYGTGLAIMGFIGWRRKRKAAA